MRERGMATVILVLREFSEFATSSNANRFHADKRKRKERKKKGGRHRHKTYKGEVAGRGRARGEEGRPSPSPQSPFWACSWSLEGITELLFFRY